MAKLVFAAADVRRVAEHSVGSPSQKKVTVGFHPATFEPITQPAEAPSIVLVHDRGVYLMSNGSPRDLIKKKSRNGKLDVESSYVAYAQGCNPEVDADWYDNANDLVGGDDFAETLPWATEIHAAIVKGARQIVINMSSKRMALSFK